MPSDLTMIRRWFVEESRDALRASGCCPRIAI